MKKEKNVVFRPQVVNAACPCGGDCTNEQGSYMIDRSCIFMTCDTCKTEYLVRGSAFNMSVIQEADSIRVIPVESGE